MGDYYSRSDYAGIFTAQTRSDEHEFRGQHGPCTEACGRYYEGYTTWKHGTDQAYYCTVNHSFISSSGSCNRSEKRIYDTFVSDVLCSPFMWTPDYTPNNAPGYAACAGSYYRQQTNQWDNCPLGWGTLQAYLNYEPGCYQGLRYPSPVPPYTDLSPLHGSRH